MNKTQNYKRTSSAISSNSLFISKFHPKSLSLTKFSSKAFDNNLVNPFNPLSSSKLRNFSSSCITRIFSPHKPYGHGHSVSTRGIFKINHNFHPYFLKPSPLFYFLVYFQDLTNNCINNPEIQDNVVKGFTNKREFNLISPSKSLEKPEYLFLDANKNSEEFFMNIIDKLPRRKAYVIYVEYMVSEDVVVNEIPVKKEDIKFKSVYASLHLHGTYPENKESLTCDPFKLLNSIMDISKKMDIDKLCFRFDLVCDISIDELYHHTKELKEKAFEGAKVVLEERKQKISCSGESSIARCAGKRSYSTSTRTFNTNGKFDNNLVNPFNQVLDTKFYPDFKSKAILLIFNFHDVFNFDILKSKITQQLQPKLLFTVFIKIRFNNDSFIMAGNQFGFSYSSDKDFADLLSIVTNRLSTTLNTYLLVDDDIIYVQLSFKKVNSRIITEFSSDQISSGSDNIIRSEINTFNIPISVDTNLGEVLTTHLNEEVNIAKIDYLVDGVVTNFLDNIKSKSKFLKKYHKDNFTIFNSSYKFYLVSTNNVKYILAIGKLSEYEYIKTYFSLNGVVLNNIRDKLIDNNIIERTNGNTKYYISDGKVINKVQDIKLFPIPLVSLEVKSTDNPNIGVIDTETYLDDTNQYKILR